MEREVKFTFDESPSMENFNKKFSETLALTAPAGYGLGASYGAPATLDTLDDINKNGWYYFGNDNYKLTIGTVQVYLDGAVMRVDKYVSIGQTIYLQNQGMNGYTIRRYLENTQWSPWEWVNPPMQLGVEYRTTERYLRKPVYVKAVDFGTLPNSTIKSVNHETEKIHYVIRCEGYIDSGESLPYVFNNSRIDVFADRTSVKVCTNYAPPSTTRAIAVMYYTKTTD